MDSKTLLVHSAATLLYTLGHQEIAEKLWDEFPLTGEPVGATLVRSTGLVESSVMGQRYEQVDYGAMDAQARLDFCRGK